MSVRHIPLTFDNSKPDQSAKELVEAFSPDWNDDDPLIFVRFTEGITNTLTKATKKRPGKSDSEIEQDAILLRAYGKGTDVLIDRERELNAHNLLASRGLAPSLLARFDNGLMYRFIQGDVCTPDDLRRPEVYRAVAKRLGEWHGSLPIAAISKKPVINGHMPGQKSAQATKTQPRPEPNTWTVMQQWIDALPTGSEKEKERKQLLNHELSDLSAKLGDTPGLFGKDYVFGHCDLLSGNVIIEQQVDQPCSNGDNKERPVSFIDYEYSTPSPAAFDIANHFAEWAGFDVDHSAMPSKSARRDFLRHYVGSFYVSAISDDHNIAMEIDMRAAIDQLYKQVDAFRGVPGFYWGIWALIQATISQIDFDYASYAELRLSEYWAWKAEADGSRSAKGEEMPLRERKWAED